MRCGVIPAAFVVAENLCKISAATAQGGRRFHLLDQITSPGGERRVRGEEMSLHFHYCFVLPDGTREEFTLDIDPVTIELRQDDGPWPEWVRLGYEQCPHCPEEMVGHEHCPMAMALASLVERFSSLLSYEEVELTVTSAERFISQQTTAQRGIASIMGLLMATCGCPHTRFLRPMARFHLPLATEEETVYRAFTMYALSQFLSCRQAEVLDVSFQGMTVLYGQLEKVNSAFVMRLRAAAQADSSVNALINLDMYAKVMPYVVEDSLEELRYLFPDENSVQSRLSKTKLYQ